MPQYSLGFVQGGRHGCESMNLLNAQQEYIQFPNLFSGLNFNVGQVAFTIFGLEVYWYGIIITAAVVLGIMYGLRYAGRVGIISDDVFEIAFWGVLAGVIGARAYYVIFSEHDYTLFEAVFGIRDGGLAIYGALIGAVTGGFIAARLKKVRFLPLTDLMGPGFLIGHSVGRWGNFFNQEAYGAATALDLPWGMNGSSIPEAHDGIALVHPCFLYESVWCFIGLIFLHFYAKKLRTFDGEVFLLYIMWYGTGRAFIEGLRTDSLMLGEFRVSQVLAAVSAVLALGLFVWFKTTLTSKKGYVMFKDTEESARLIEEHNLKIKIEKEKEKAKIALSKTNRELTEPFNEISNNHNEEDGGNDGT